jgi:hypothetical protein
MQRRQHQMAGERGLDRDAAGFQIAHFADHDHVRILAHDRAQRAGEIQPDLRLHLDLVDAFELVFDRILDRDDLHVRRVDLRQRGVQRGGLARTGRAGDQQDAVRTFQHVDETLLEVVGETERGEIEHHRFAIEDTHHHRLAEAGRHGRYAQVEFLALHAQLDAAVLRQAALGDVELAP